MTRLEGYGVYGRDHCNGRTSLQDKRQRKKMGWVMISRELMRAHL